MYRSRTICRKSKAVCPFSRVLSVPIYSLRVLKREVNMFQTNKHQYSEYILVTWYSSRISVADGTTATLWCSTLFYLNFLSQSGQWLIITKTAIHHANISSILRVVENILYWYDSVSIVSIILDRISTFVIFHCSHFVLCNINITTLFYSAQYK